MKESPIQDYKHTADMGEISGFGGEYEAGCQTMLDAGVKWLNSRPQADLQAKEFKNVYGVLMPESEDAKELSEVVLKSLDESPTGAMHHAVMGRLFFIAQNGWDKYCAELRANEKEQAA